MNITNKLILENSKALNVLCIDDDKTLLDATSKLLLNFFNSVDTAMDGEEGLKMYLDYKSCQNHYYDLVITDINMPKMNGIEMSKKIKDENFEQAIIFVTAHDELDYLHNAIKLGADGFLIKPLEMTELKNVLYKTTQAIADRYIVRKYYDQIEELNIQLVEKKGSFTKEIKGHSEEDVSKIEKETDSVAELKNEQNLVYSEYVFEADVYELQDLEQEIDSLAIAVTMNSNSTLQSHTLLGLKIKRYGEILSNYPLFEELGSYIVKLGVNLSQNSEILFNDREKMSNITALIEGFVNDLIIWRKEIFINNIENYKFLDSSISSNVDTIIIFIKYDEVRDGSSYSGDMEFF